MLEAKLNYIRAWESLLDFGVSYFLVKFSGVFRAKEVRKEVQPSLLSALRFSIDIVAWETYSVSFLWSLYQKFIPLFCQFPVDSNLHVNHGLLHSHTLCSTDP